MNRPMSLGAALSSFLLLVSIASTIGAPGCAAVPPLYHDPILITGDSDFTAANGVTGGNGTAENPYVIAGWFIPASFEDGIEVNGTTAHFIIRDVLIDSGRIWIHNSEHAWIENATLSNDGWGIQLEGANNTVVKGCIVEYAGIEVSNSDSCTLIGNLITANFNPGHEIHGGYGVAILDSTNVTLYSNVLESMGVAIQGVMIDKEDLLSTIISENNTVNGKPILFHKSQSGLNLNAVDVGEVILLNCSNALISNIALNDTFQGMVIAHCDNLTIEYCSFSNWTALLCDESANLTVRNSTFETGGFSIIQFLECSNFVVQGNELTEGGYIWLGDCNNGSVTSNLVSSGNDSLFGWGIVVFSNNVTFSGNHLESCGVYPGWPSYENISFTPDNTVNGKPLVCHVSEDGVIVDSVDVGQLLIFDCTNATVRNVTVSGPVNNAILISSSTNVTVTNSSLVGCNYGLSIDHSDRCRLDRNNFTNNSWSGARIVNSFNCTVSGNSFVGSYSSFSIFVVDGAIIYGNEFEGRCNQGDGCANVSWDAGYPTGGNYWSEYTGLDMFHGPAQNIAGPDGIGDQPYEFDQFAPGVVDRYPLMPDNDVPVAHAGEDIYVLVGEQAQFNGSLSTDDYLVTNYSWNFTHDGGSVTLYGPTPDFTFLVPGQYQVTLTVTDTRNRTACDTMLVVVTAAPIPQFSGLFPLLLSTLAMVGLAACRKRSASLARRRP